MRGWSGSRELNPGSTRTRKPHTDLLRMWAEKLMQKKPFKVVALALANKMARIAFAIMRAKTSYWEIPA
jgi:transposase